MKLKNYQRHGHLKLEWSWKLWWVSGSCSYKLPDCLWNLLRGFYDEALKENKDNKGELNAD